MGIPICQFQDTQAKEVTMILTLLLHILLLPGHQSQPGQPGLGAARLVYVAFSTQHDLYQQRYFLL